MWARNPSQFEELAIFFCVLLLFCSPQKNVKCHMPHDMPVYHILYVRSQKVDDKNNMQTLTRKYFDLNCTYLSTGFDFRRVLLENSNLYLDWWVPAFISVFKSFKFVFVISYNLLLLLLLNWTVHFSSNTCSSQFSPDPNYYIHEIHECIAINVRWLTSFLFHKRVVFSSFWCCYKKGI